MHWLFEKSGCKRGQWTVRDIKFQISKISKPDTYYS
jgi:hypothetical protein